MDIMELFEYDNYTTDREIAQKVAVSARIQSRKSKVLKNEIGSITLILLALIKSLIDRGIFSHDEFCEIIKELDIEDGSLDGKSSINKLRSILNFPSNKYNKRMTQRKTKKSKIIPIKRS